jgi:hypothetical protein
MALNEAQLTIFRAALAAETDPELVGYREAGMAALISEWYNRPASPTKIVWRTSVSNDEIGDAMNGTEVAGMSSLNMQRAQMLANYSSGFQNPSRFDRRDAFERIFSGASGQNTRAALAIIWRRTTNRIEALFAVGTGTNESPATLGYEGTLTDLDVSRAVSE